MIIFTSVRQPGLVIRSQHIISELFGVYPNAYVTTIAPSDYTLCRRIPSNFGRMYSYLEQPSLIRINHICHSVTSFGSLNV